MLKMPGGGIIGEVTKESPGGTQEAHGKHRQGTQEAPRAPKAPEASEREKKEPLSAKLQKLNHLFKLCGRFLRVGVDLHLLL